ncbi:unnamed protein product [Cylicocyclus nassatus]|uniref:Endonuclease n=1 Tax=Cylicocyclus nassatus TaxID=53992 RepID=A0AA36DMI2_CYLNA|nr:unnamed protein product [Cylicocyclus nassatus]
MSRTNRTLVTAKQQLSRHLNDILRLVEDCSKYKEGWQFPKVRKELYVFTRTQRSVIQTTIAKLESKIDTVMQIYGDTMENLSSSDSDNARVVETKEGFDAYWVEKDGENTLEAAREMVQNLEMRMVELSVQEMQLACADEFEEIEKQRANETHVTQFVTPNTFISQSDIPQPRSSQIPAHWYRKELRIPEFFGNPMEFEQFWEIFAELVDKQPYSDIEKLTILLDKCKGEAARALKYLPRKGSSYKNAVLQLKEQFQNNELNVKLLLQQLDSIPTSSNDAMQLRTTLNDLMAVIVPLSRAETHIDAREYKSKVLQKFPEAVQSTLLSKEYDEDKTWTMEQLLEEIRKVVKKCELTQIHTCTSSAVPTKSTVLLTKPRKVAQYRCAACEGAHKLKFCNRFRTVQARRQRIVEMGKCFKCFSTQHLSSQCKKSNCRNCGEPHNIAICNNFDNQKKDVNYRNQSVKPYQADRRNSFNARNRSRSHSSERNFRFRSKSRSRSPPAYSNRHRYRSRTRSPTPYRYRKNSRESILAHTTNIITDESVSSSEEEDEELVQINKIRTIANNWTDPRLMIIMLPLRNNETRNIEKVYALLDTGATRSFISENLANRLQLATVKDASYVLSTFGGNRVRKTSREVLAQAIVSNSEHLSMHLLTSEPITEPVTLARLSSEDIKYASEKNIESGILNDMDIETLPEVLVGIDYYNEILDISATPIQLPSGLYAVPTIFGHAITGLDGNTISETVMSFNSSTSFYEETSPDFSAMWNLENMGITDTISETEENQKILKEFYDTIEIRNKEIYVKFPWKSNKMELDNNYKIAFSRLMQLYNSLSSKKDLWEKYCKIIEEQLRKKIVEDVPSKSQSKDCPLYYIPHQAVLKPSSNTTKVRIVLDASAKRVGQLSLNDVLYKGPTLLPTLLGILLRARTYEYILIGDVEKAFHMIRLQESQRDATRFLWLNDPHKPPTPNNIRKLRFTRVPFGTKTSPALLAMSIKYMLDRNKQTELCQQIARNLYVDNMVLGANSDEDAVVKYQKSKHIFEEMSMNLRQFATNSSFLRHKIAEEDKEPNQNVKILGILWNTSNDTILLKSELKFQQQPTKRKVLQTIHSTFDPLGLLIPVLIPARIFLQTLWVKKYDWDQPLSESDENRWKTICLEGSKFVKSLKRFIGTKKTECFELFTFVDASTNAYAACSYLRSSKDNIIETELICGKYRLAPVSYLTGRSSATIPKLELLAIFIGYQLTDYLLNELDIKISKIHIFSDSNIALSQVHFGKSAGTFVNNRVRKIRARHASWTQKHIETCCYYINTAENPADCATRGLKISEFGDHQWWTGPSFLRAKEEEWSSVTKYEMKWNDSEVVMRIFLKSVNERTPIFRYGLSHWDKLRRSTAVMLKFIKKIAKNRYRKTEDDDSMQSNCKELYYISDLVEHSAKDLILAENVLIRDHYLHMTNEQFRKYEYLHLYLDNNIYRCSSRLANSHLGEEATNPILILPYHQIAKALIVHYHKKIGHQGVNSTLAAIHRKYWIPQGRQVVKKVLRNCITCKKMHGLPYRYPEPPVLPSERVRQSHPFENVGIDYAGPFTVKILNNVHEKRWICLLTCMTTRAIHLETVDGLSAIDFIQALRRFIARRGTPRYVISDNATTFKLGHDVIEQLLKENRLSTKINHFLSTNGISWKFITPLSPWKGGFYERLIGNVKTCLRKTIKRKFLSDNEFRTVCAECEAIVNARPLTYVTSDFHDYDPIRPVDFLQPNAHITLWNFEPDYDPSFRLLSSKNEAIQLLEETRKLLKKFWEVWSQTYLDSLRNLRMQVAKRSAKISPQQGDVVLLMDENSPRTTWNMGIVTKVHTGEDQVIRSADVRNAKGNIMRRSINMLIPLELSSGESYSDAVEAQSTPSEEHIRRVQPPRKAKKKVTYAEKVDVISNSFTKINTNTSLFLTLLLSTIISCTSADVTAKDNNVSCVKGGILLSNLTPVKMSDVPGPSKYSEVDMEENEEEDGNTPNNTPSMDAFGEEVANPIQDLIDKLNEELEQLRKDAKEKEMAAKKARENINRIEQQLKSLLHEPRTQPTENRVQEPTPQPQQRAAAQEQAMESQSKFQLVEKGKCKFACGSSTHTYATDCDVYATISDRRERMRQMHLCIRCFQQHMSNERLCAIVPCFYCSTANREMKNHISALCPFVFPKYRHQEKKKMTVLLKHKALF